MGVCSSAPRKKKVQPRDLPVKEATEPVVSEKVAEQIALTQLELIFDSIDTNADGNVSQIELRNALRDDSLVSLIKASGMSGDGHALEQLDTNQDGVVTWDEFYWKLKKAAVAEVQQKGTLAAVEDAADKKALLELKFIFQSIDTDSDNSVSKAELSAALDRAESLGVLLEDAGFNLKQEILDQLDIDKDGVISWAEFDKHLRPTAKEEVKETGQLAAAVALEVHDAPVEEVPASAAPKGGYCCCG